MGEAARKVDPLRPPKPHPRIRFDAPVAPELTGVDLRGHFKRLGVRSRNEREYLTLVCLWSQREGYAFAFQRTLAKRLDVTDRTVQAYQAKFTTDERPWLTVVRTGRENHVYPNWQALSLVSAKTSDQTRSDFGSPSLDDQRRPAETTERAAPADRPPSPPRARVEMRGGDAASPSEVDPPEPSGEDRPRPAPGATSSHRTGASLSERDPFKPPTKRPPAHSGADGASEGAQTPGVVPAPVPGEDRAVSGCEESRPHSRKSEDARAARDTLQVAPARPVGDARPRPGLATSRNLATATCGASPGLLPGDLTEAERAYVAARLAKVRPANPGGFLRACVLPDVLSARAREDAAKRADEQWAAFLRAQTDAALASLSLDLEERIVRASEDPEHAERLRRQLALADAETARRGAARPPEKRAGRTVTGPERLGDLLRAIVDPEPGDRPLPPEPKPVTRIATSSAPANGRPDPSEMTPSRASFFHLIPRL